MRNLVTYKPLRTNLPVWSNLFDDFFNFEVASSNDIKKPSADVIEKKDSYLLNIELPGFDENEVDIRLEKDVLTIQAERKFAKEEEKDSRYIVSERVEKFSRSFVLPENSDSEKVSAKFENGILSIDVLKKEKSEPKKIEIGK